MFKKLTCDYETYCDKCDKLVYEVYVSEHGTGGLKVYCEKCFKLQNKK